MRRLQAATVLCLLLASPAASRTVDESVTLEPGEPVRIDIAFGELKIVGTDQARLRAHGEIDEGLSGLRLARDGGALEVRTKLPFRSWLRRLRHDEPRAAVQLTIELPRHTPLFVVTREGLVDVQELSGRLGVVTVAADVEIRGALESVAVESVSGDIELRGGAERWSAHSLSGDVRLWGDGGGLALETVDGAIEVRGANLKGRLRTVSGTVLFEGDVANDGLLEIDTEAGPIEVRADTRAQRIDLLTDRGRVVDRRPDVEAPLPDQRSLLAGDGGGTLRVRTFSASIIMQGPASEGPPSQR
ncbi:MAG: hypothetical protein AAGA81_10215 [Acidobacteriota bacterium]